MTTQPQTISEYTDAIRHLSILADEAFENREMSMAWHCAEQLDCLREELDELILQQEKQHIRNMITKEA